MKGFTDITTTTCRWLPRLILFLAAALLGQSVLAIGPDNYGYTAASIPIAFIEDDLGNMASATGILDNTDDAAVTIPIGFTFTFYGKNYTSVSVSSNGLLTFGGADTGYRPVDFKTTAPPANLPTIAPLWHDWTFLYLGSDEVYYETLGTPGSRRLIVQWNFAQSATSTSQQTVTFQVKLFEGSNNIEFHYSDTTFTDDASESNGRGSTVGIRDVNGQTSGRNLVWSFDQVGAADGSAIRFTAPVFKTNSITRLANKNIVLQCTGAPSKPNYIEVSPNLTTGTFTRVMPAITADAAGNFPFTDTTTTGVPRRFYRVGYP